MFWRERLTCPDKQTLFSPPFLSQVENSTADIITQPKTYALFLLNFIGQDRWTCLSFCWYNIFLDLSLYFLSLVEWMIVTETTFWKGRPGHFLCIIFLWIPFPFPPFEPPPPFPNVWLCCNHEILFPWRQLSIQLSSTFIFDLYYHQSEAFACPFTFCRSLPSCLS